MPGKWKAFTHWPPARNDDGRANEGRTTIAVMSGDDDDKFNGIPENVLVLDSLSTEAIYSTSYHDFRGTVRSSERNKSFSSCLKAAGKDL